MTKIEISVTRITEKPKVKPKLCRTVGALIKELGKLPKTARLSSLMRPVHYNTGVSAKGMGLTPQVGFEDY